MHRSTTKKVIEFIKEYIAQFGVPKKIRTDPGAVCMSEAFSQFCIDHVTCPVRDHKGNGISERFRANKEIILTKDKSGLSEIFYSQE